jgi:hypothetical protein
MTAACALLTRRNTRQAAVRAAMPARRRPHVSNEQPAGTASHVAPPISSQPRIHTALRTNNDSGCAEADAAADDAAADAADASLAARRWRVGVTLMCCSMVMMVAVGACMAAAAGVGAARPLRAAGTDAEAAAVATPLMSWHAACAGPMAVVALLVCAFPHWYAGAYFSAA